ncbi:chaperonin cofactor prefoldin [Brevundimonas bullata]|uniref:Chaperonin cofactor prefoldin n=1 Tax=Brevundimonas bullata TaxID=13160 RepID=A0A7W7N3Q7_9CAUL|nr:phage terminase small subunit [Brevundimonas bullata]MBB4797596.1 chaperonin cofactor prefoldin [Brevundimonas bullata]MBB6382556.1 chaperonin cofactor prefoldin [Brevundimonas bullata]
MSIAAQARARAEAAAQKKAEDEASAASAAMAKRRPAKIKPALRPAPSVPDINPNRVSPAAQRRRFLIASSAGAVLAASGIAIDIDGDNDDTPLSPDAQKVVFQLQQDRRRLKEFKATERKVEAKIDMLPAYRGWCDGVLAAGQGERGPLDQIFTTIMAWTIDVGDYMTALPMLEHAVKYKLEMPSGFNRDPITFAIDQVCEEAIRVYDLGGDAAKAFEAGVLPMLQDLVDEHDIDLHDEVEAKLFKAIGRAIMAGADIENEDDLRQRREETLKSYQRALELHERCGVKKDIEKLTRELKKAAGVTEPADQNTPPPAGG